VIPEGQEIDTPCIGMDLFPTMLAMAGIESPADLKLDGLDILPVMKGEKNDLGRDLYWRFKGKLAIRSGKWKLVLNEKDARKSLHDLERDLSESKNVAANHRELVRELEAKLDAWQKEVSRGEPLS
jgi:arylsulfatase A-like enzyme